VATGQTDFELEQKNIMGPFASRKDGGGIVSDLARIHTNKHLYTFEDGALEGLSNIDVLICTSGRLLDHLQLTKGFTLQHLRFLVLDEADRLLGNAYHGWVRSLVHSASATTQSFATIASDGDSSARKKQRLSEGEADGQAKTVAVNEDLLHSYQELRPPLQRLLFSATLTDNPSKLAMLGIYSPLLIHSSSYGPPAAARTPAGAHADGEEVEEGDEGNAEEGLDATHDGSAKFSLPAGLTESRIICESENRPITLISLVLEALSEGSESAAPAEGETAKAGGKGANKHQHRGLCGEPGSMCIVFTSSVEETHRLCKLLQLVNGQIDMNGRIVKSGDFKFRGRVEEMSRTVRADERTRIMESCKAGAVAVLVSSDHLARGIDLPNIRLVINYDPPKHAKTYVHRAGRTARAQRTGHCVSILNTGQLGAFRKLRGQVHDGDMTQDQFNALIKKCSVRKSTEESVSEVYKRSIKRLSSILKQG
jgi:ATP-dependent RNA helicase DDX51/DBP6